MDYPLAQWEGPPITLAGLFHYTRQKQQALNARDELSTRIASINRILERLASNFPLIRSEMASLEQRITLATPRVGRVMIDGRNWEDHCSNIDFEIEANVRQRDAKRDQCRRVFRALAQKHHPDKGGDLSIFQRLQEAVLSLDLEFLRVQQALDFDECRLTWRCGEGIKFWDLQNEKVYVNSRKLESLLQYKAVSAYIAGQRQRAVLMMQDWMEQRLLMLKHELAHILTPRPSGPMIDDVEQLVV